MRHLSLFKFFKTHFLLFICLFTFISFLFLTAPQSTLAFESSPDALEVKVTSIIDQKIVTFDEIGNMIDASPACIATPDTCPTQTYQKFQATVLTPPEKQGQLVTIISGNSPTIATSVYQIGDQLIVEPDLFSPQSLLPSNPDSDLNATNSASTTQTESTYHVNDYLRRNSLVILFIVFLIIVFIVTRWKGLRAVIGMFYSFFIIFQITIPNIMNGHNPFLIAILTIVLILPPTFYFSHGFNRQSNAALVGTAIALLLTTVVGYLAIKGVRLTGFSNEEVNFILSLMGNRINIQGLLMAGIMISALGTLNDVTVSQAAIVKELKQENPHQSFGELYSKAMHIGRDHIVSMVDTLILVYAGGSLPLLILIADSSRSLAEVINYEMIAEEIVKMLVGSIGIILAVPITTAVACFFFEE